MNRKQLFGAIIALMVLAVPFAAVAPVLASENVAFDGTDADASDQTNTTYIATNSDLVNFTAQMTENQSYTADESKKFATNITATSAAIDSATNASNLSVNVVDDGVWVNETGSASNTLHSLNITFAVNETPSTNGSLPDAVNVSYSNWMENETDLVNDPDESETHTYLVYARDKVVDVTYEVVGADLEFNASSNELEANGSDGHGQLVFHVTRNNTTYEGVSLDSLKFAVELNTSFFNDINEETSEGADRIVLEDVKSTNGSKTFVWDIVKEDNTTRSYDVKVNVSATNGEANHTLVETSRQDPTGGVQVDDDAAFDHAIPAGTVVTGPEFFQVTQTTLIALAIGGLVLLLLIITLVTNRDEEKGMRGFAAYQAGNMMWAWVILTTVGVTMIIDFFTGFNFWTNLTQLSPMAVLVVGALLTVASIGINVQNSTGEIIPR